MCSTEKAKAVLKKGNNVTNLLLDTSNNLIPNNSDSDFKNIDSDLNNKCNIDSKPSLILHTPLNTSKNHYLQKMTHC